MQETKSKDFSTAEHDTWRQLYGRLEYCRQNQAHPIFAEGLLKLGISGHEIPNLTEVNNRLKTLTGWQGTPVVGLEDDGSFFQALKEKKFPIGNFIRDAQDLNYTPAPDIFHDLYGHMPFFANTDYAHFCQSFGEVACKYLDSPEIIKLFARLFWFGVEFPLVETDQGRRIFGGGILSSFGESNYSLSTEPTILSFDLLQIKDHHYKIDEFQTSLYLLKNPVELYQCLPRFEQILLQTTLH